MRFDKLHGFTSAAVALAAGLFGLCAQPAWGIQLHNGLISYWTLAEGSGTTAGDTAAGGSSTDNGTLRNSPTWVDGKFGNGLQFNGVDQDVLIPNNTDMNIGTNAVTLSTWVKLDQLPSEIVGSFSGILDSQPDNFVMYLDKGNNELRFKATNVDNVSTLAAQHPGVRASMLNTSDWLHVMGVYDGDAGNAKIFFNGQLTDITYQASNTTLLYKGPVRAGQVSGLGSQVATDDPHAASNLFQGMISDVAVWNRALGAAEAQYLFNGGIGNSVGAANPDISPLPPIQPLLPTAQPVVYYKFDGDLNNYGTGGASLNATLHDVAGRNDNLYSATNFGQGMDLTGNPLSTSSLTEPGDYLSVDYTLTDSGTIATRFTASQLANFVTLWSNSSHENDWESWVYGDGRVAARANRSTPIVANNIFLQEDPTASQHYAFTWQRNGAQMLVRMFVNGEFVDERLGDWQDPGSTFFIAGGVATTGVANHLGTGVYDEFRIYNQALSEAELLYLSMFAPETIDTLAGDFNNNGVVDAADYVVWRNGLGTTHTPEQYNVWRANFGTTLGGGGRAAVAVPEPAAAGIAMIATLVGGALLRCRRRSHR